MPTFQRAFPKHKPFKCSAAWHLRKSGLYLGVYDLIGGITNGGSNKFFSTVLRVSEYFGSDYETTRRVFKNLTRQGWLELTGEGEWRYITHDVRAFIKDDCNKRELLSWQVETDPLVGKLWAAAEGKLRVVEHKVVALRKYGTDEEIVALFKAELEKAEANKLLGKYTGTAPVSCLYRVMLHLKQKQNNNKN